MQTNKQTKVTLKEIYEEIRKLLYIEDTKLIDLILAVFISRKQTHAKLWVIIIGPSSDGKTELIELFNNEENYAYELVEITSNTLVNGYKNKAKQPDLAPKLRNKVVLIPEMASIANLHPDELRKVWAQLKRLYDGKAGKCSGQGTEILYKDLNISLIGCSTASIENKVIINQNMGTRELLYKTEEKNEEETMNKVIENMKIDTTPIKISIKQKIKQFLEEREYNDIEKEEGSGDSEDSKEIRKWARVLTTLRATAPTSSTDGKLTEKIEIEKPSRVLKQLIVLYNSLKSLDENYSNKKAMEIIKKIALSCCQTTRIEIVQYLIEKGTENSRRNVGKALEISKDTAYAQLNILTALGITERIDTTIDEERELYYSKFKINTDNEIVKLLKHEKTNNITEEEIIHQNCYWCNLTPCKSWSKSGKPLCELCATNPDLINK